MTTSTANTGCLTEGKKMKVTQQKNIDGTKRFFIDEVDAGHGMQFDGMYIDIGADGKCTDSSLKIGSKPWQSIICKLSRAGLI